MEARRCNYSKTVCSVPSVLPVLLLSLLPLLSLLFCLFLLFLLSLGFLLPRTIPTPSPSEAGTHWFPDRLHLLPARPYPRSLLTDGSEMPPSAIPPGSDRLLPTLPISSPRCIHFGHTDNSPPAPNPKSKAVPRPYRDKVLPHPTPDRMDPPHRLKKSPSETV